MGIRYEWVTAEYASPTIARKNHMPDGQPVEEDDRDTYIDEMVTADLAVVLGDGNPLVIEGAADELAALFTRCLELVTNERQEK